MIAYGTSSGLGPIWIILLLCATTQMGAAQQPLEKPSGQFGPADGSQSWRKPFREMKAHVRTEQFSRPVYKTEMLDQEYWTYQPVNQYVWRYEDRVWWNPRSWIAWGPRLTHVTQWQPVLWRGKLPVNRQEEVTETQVVQETVPILGFRDFSRAGSMATTGAHSANSLKSDELFTKLTY